MSAAAVTDQEISLCQAWSVLVKIDSNFFQVQVLWRLSTSPSTVLSKMASPSTVLEYISTQVLEPSPAVWEQPYPAVLNHPSCVVTIQNDCHKPDNNVNYINDSTAWYQLVETMTHHWALLSFRVTSVLAFIICYYVLSLVRHTVTVISWKCSLWLVWFQEPQRNGETRNTGICVHPRVPGTAAAGYVTTSSCLPRHIPLKSSFTSVN